ncbi:hypothetical protein TNCT_243391 [Trichonephila clavata]|uniref:Uncharacterized protein n=1 Tax=Trichonephila clavata TaxID=2740835 RepID=A0A8X6GTQ3_TRICU|nr:hypothetical protein TNCT_243391 [Trichonephila clavata]
MSVTTQRQSTHNKASSFIHTLKIPKPLSGDTNFSDKATRNTLHLSLNNESHISDNLDSCVDRYRLRICDTNLQQTSNRNCCHCFRAFPLINGVNRFI